MFHSRFIAYNNQVWLRLGEVAKSYNWCANLFNKRHLLREF